MSGVGPTKGVERGIVAYASMLRPRKGYERLFQTVTPWLFPGGSDAMPQASRSTYRSGFDGPTQEERARIAWTVRRRPSHSNVVSLLRPVCSLRRSRLPVGVYSFRSEFCFVRDMRSSRKGRARWTLKIGSAGIQRVTRTGPVYCVHPFILHVYAICHNVSNITRTL